MMDETLVKLYILDKEDAEPRCARMPCEGVATLEEFRALLEKTPSPIPWPFDFYDAEMKGRIATESEQSSILKWYDHKVTVIRSNGMQSMVESMAVMEPTTVEEGSSHTSTISKAHAACKDEPEEVSCSKLDPKHKVFLSHSGDEKPFVGKLCKLLEEYDYYPFFDQQRDSLPKGEKFPNLIIEAAQKCLVGVVVLSDGYLTSKWPMIELAEFVRARKFENKNMKLLPLFFKVFVADLDDAVIKTKWMPKWKVLAQKDPRVDPKVWAEAVQELRRSNGLVFHESDNKESYRNAIVEAIFELVPPNLLFDTSKILGRDRICEILANKFQEHPQTGASLLGLYGMGGLGKTTISKCLYNHFSQNFLGRVCYIEMQDGKDALMRQKIVMRKVLRLVGPMMENINYAYEGWDVLKSRMKEKPIFLAIDNVGPDEVEEALKYLNVKYNLRSKIMVVSRSLDIVERLLGDRGYCYETPSLERKEAVGILLQQGGQNLKYSSLSKDEREIVEGFVEEASFGDQDIIQTTSWCKNGGKQYHPLALRALGAYLQKKSKTWGVLSWVAYKDEYRELKATGEPYKKLFKILGLQFRTLDKKKQLMYLDIVLYAPSALKDSLLSNSPLEDLGMWLASVHGMAIAVVNHWISYFSEFALLNIEREKIIIHDLYKEYALWALKNVGNSQELVGVWCDGLSTQTASIPEEFQKLPSQNCWQELRRICLQKLSFRSFPVKKFQEWQNVVLQIISRDNVTTLNFQALTSLRHLELKDLKHLETLILIGNESTSHDIVPQANCVEPKQYFPLPQLQYVVLNWLLLLKFLSSFSPFTSLKYLEVVGCRKLREPPRIQHCSKLERMKLQWYPEHKTFPNLDGLTSLRDLTIGGPSWERRYKALRQEYEVLKLVYETLKLEYEALKLEGLSSLSSLRALELEGIPIGDLSGLENLTNVEYICLHCLYRLQDLPPLKSLASSSLHMLHVYGCGEHIQRLEKPLQMLIRHNLGILEAQVEYLPRFPNSKIDPQRLNTSEGFWSLIEKQSKL